MDLMKHLGSRISSSVVDGRVVVCVNGAELFDLVDDHMTQRLDDDFLVRLPEARADRSHELIFSPNVTLQDVIAVLDELPKDEKVQALAADDA
ncbi:MAG: hypothetical protein CMP06_08585 [Xanthomonadales bacterium]|nr:hypothetical protein [Xanthomonadales bacterium]